MSNLLLVAGALSAVAALFAAYVLAVARYYRVRSPRPQRLLLRTEDGGTLAVYHRAPAQRRFLEPVLLCHGLAVNHLNFDFDPPYSLAHVLAEAGFHCFSVDWRGTGDSRPPPGRHRYDFDVDDNIDQDAPALLQAALAQARAPQALWVGHSLGALIGYGALATPAGSSVKGLCALGAPVFYAYRPWLRKLVGVGTALAWPRAFHQRWMSLALAPFLGYVTIPLSDTMINPEAIAPPIQRKVYANLIQSLGYRLLRQFHDWISHDAFRSGDTRRDYRTPLSEVKLPVLVMGGSQDQLASPHAVQSQFELLGSADKTLMLFGPENGDTLAYGHGDLLFGAHAPKEVYPRIRDWLVAHATPVTTPSEPQKPE